MFCWVQKMSVSVGQQVGQFVGQWRLWPMVAEIGQGRQWRAVLLRLTFRTAGSRVCLAPIVALDRCDRLRENLSDQFFCETISVSVASTVLPEQSPKRTALMKSPLEACASPKTSVVRNVSGCPRATLPQQKLIKSTFGCPWATRRPKCRPVPESG